MLILKYKLKQRNIKFCSHYIIQFYKKFLSIKLSIYYNKCNYINIINNKLKLNSIKLLNQIKIFYNRKEYIPLRILRYYLYFDLNYLIQLKINTFISNKLSVYNGKKAKPINIFKVQ